MPSKVEIPLLWGFQELHLSEEVSGLINEAPRDPKLQRTGRLLKAVEMLMFFLPLPVAWHSY